MKKKLSLICAAVMLATECLSAGMVSAEANTSSAELISEHGKLVALQDFEQEKAEAAGYIDTKYLDSISWDFAPSGLKAAVVDNPDQSVGGKVLDGTFLENQSLGFYGIRFNGNKMYDGKYHVTFDYYSEAEKTDFGCGWFSWHGMRLYPIAQSNGSWVKMEYPSAITATTDYSQNIYGDTTFTYSGTKVVNGTEAEPNPQIPSFGFHYSHPTTATPWEKATYFDNIKVYYFPENSYILCGVDNKPAELIEFDETAAYTTLPTADGIYGWTLDGKFFYPAGARLKTSDLLGKYLTLKPVTVPLYDDDKGELLLYYDYDIENAGINTPTYINKEYFDTFPNSYVGYPNVDMAKTGIFTTDDSGNKALKQYTATNSSYGFIRTDAVMKSGLSYPKSQYTVDFRFMAIKDGFNYGFKESHTNGGTLWFNNAGGGAPGYTFASDVDYDKWMPVSIKHINSQDYLASWGLTMNPSSAEYDTSTYYDDVKIYFFPSTRMHFKASAESAEVAAVDADAQGNITVPTKQETGLNISGRVTAWKASDGTTVTVGETVKAADFAAKTYYPVITELKASFSYSNQTGEFTLGDGDTFTVPSPTEINPAWTGTFDGWLCDGNIYAPGDIANVDDFVGKTFTAITEAGLATIYLDEAQTVKKTYAIASGESILLPGYDELSSYTPRGEIAKGFNIYGKLYAPGERIVFDESSISFTTVAVYDVPLYAEDFGNLVLYENFETLEPGVSYNNTLIPISYTDGTYTDGFDNFQFRSFHDALYTIKENAGNNALEIRTNPDAGDGISFPQIQLFGNGTYLNLKKEGIYTVTADATVLEDAPINVGVRPTSDNGYIEGGGSSGTGGNFKMVHSQLEVSGATAREALVNCLWFISAQYDDDKYVLLDNISMYAKTNKYHITINSEVVADGFFAPGRGLTLPDSMLYQEHIPAGYEFSHYEINSVKYNPGDIYKTSFDDVELDINFVINKTNYYASFNLGSINKTLSDITVNLNESFTLPEISDEGFIGWRLYGTKETLSAGTTFTLTKENLNIDEYNRFVFEAVTENDGAVTLNTLYSIAGGAFADATEEELKFIKAAYGVGLIPAAVAFDREKTVSVGELLTYAVDLYNISNGINADYSDITAVKEYAVSVGINSDFSDSDAPATFKDLADILANVLPDGYYKDTYNNVTTNPDSINENAEKLINVGIIEKDVNFSNTVTYKDVVFAMARTVDNSLRIYDKTKTLYILGDSLCAGVAGNPGWVDKILDITGDRINVVNYAIGGINTGSYLVTYNTTSSEYYKKYLSEVKPGDYVMIALGTNDATLWSGTVENQHMSYEESLENYRTLAEDAYFYGAQPFFVVPAGWNLTDENGKYNPYNVEEAKLIMNCMQECNDTYGLDVPIINFKDITVERFGAMTAEERGKIYVDPVHYTDYGSGVICGIFAELIRLNEDAKLLTLKNCFTKNTLEQLAISTLTITNYKNETATIVSPEAYENVALIFATYDENDKLIDFKYNPNQTISQGTGYYSLDIDTTNAKTISVYIWDNMTDLVPLCPYLDTAFITDKN